MDNITKAFGQLKPIQMGTVFLDNDKECWVFLGYYTNTESTELHFARLAYTEIYHYKAVRLDTLMQKFPGIIYHLKREGHES